MAANKFYTVVKDGEELEKLKTLAAAKKLADTEGAEVYSDGECVYRADVTAEEKAVSVEQAKTVEKSDTPVAKEKSATERAEESAGQKYRLKALMNVRTKPSLDGKKVGTKQAGEIVDVYAIEGDWLHLTDGTYILYQGGEFAEIV